MTWLQVRIPIIEGSSCPSSCPSSSGAMKPGVPLCKRGRQESVYQAEHGWKEWPSLECELCHITGVDTEGPGMMVTSTTHQIRFCMCVHAGMNWLGGGAPGIQLCELLLEPSPGRSRRSLRPSRCGPAARCWACSRTKSHSCCADTSGRALSPGLGSVRSGTNQSCGALGCRCGCMCAGLRPASALSPAAPAGARSIVCKDPERPRCPFCLALQIETGLFTILDIKSDCSRPPGQS